ncbi:unnamed protein product [Nesidiocoris tenuis]|uniref:Uncharacterized protein n=1 Tax=Nesidiocoris tenuis TaxID=355587 RepID=A0A6H5HXF0_9HEMI|nr:unnamed protein product [Nesidiocoris tenuis]
MLRHLFVDFVRGRSIVIAKGGVSEARTQYISQRLTANTKNLNGIELFQKSPLWTPYISETRRSRIN